MDWLAQRAAQNPSAPALEFIGQKWDYAALNDWVETLAAQLEAREIKRQTRVAIHLANQPAYIALIHALARIGAIAVPLNRRLTESEIKLQIEQSQCGYLICESELPGPAKRIPVSDLSSTPQPLPARTHPPLEPDAVQGIFFTSGTSGFPKGAMLTFDNHHASALASAKRLGVDLRDRWLLTMPLYHIGGMSIVFRAALYGFAVVLHPHFDVDAVHHALTEEDITVVSLVPTMLHRLLEKYPALKPSSSLRAILLGGAGAPVDLLEKALALNLPLALTYGLTEAASQVATSTPEQTRAKPGSVGKPLPGTTVDIVDEAGKSLPNGEIGEIVISGRTVMCGYLDSEKPSEPFHTGDIGYLDAEGDLWVLTRRTDLIVSGGENVYPEEVERVLLTHPSVSEACVVGVPDPEWGQAVAAAVVLREPCSGEALIQFLRGQVAAYKVPRRIVFVEALPRTASGKLKRTEIADLPGFKDLQCLTSKP
ncbi:MAG: o-succinylbenzoate--CoA ligase [Chloroflexota bacterium]